MPGHGLVAETAYSRGRGVREWVGVGGLGRQPVLAKIFAPPPPAPSGGVTELLGCGFGFGSGLRLLWVEAMTVRVARLLLFFIGRVLLVVPK